MEVLTQEEIDRMLTAVIDTVDFEPVFRSIDDEDFRLAKPVNFQEFESFLTKRQYQPEKPYGIFEEDVTMCRFFLAQRAVKISLRKLNVKTKIRGWETSLFPAQK
ncbi:hypothetical protein AGMMS50230_20530 [Spirochaetia bacterium]|nr:hypothetical protein AGMMS50230_20530 [Spirochaetia bacterium]